MSDIDYTQYKLGANPSPQDSRDFSIARLVAQVNVFPEEFVLPYNHEIKNQGSINSCTCNSMSYCREILEEIQNSVYKKFSVGFLYGNRIDTDYQGTGWYPRELLNHVLNEGACEYDLFPYDEEYPAVKDKLTQNKDVLMTNAYPHRISAYARINTLDEIKNALYLLKSPVTFILKVCPSFYQINKNNPIFTPPTTSERWYGSHELTIVGYKQLNGQEVLIVLNSWGKDWADGGYFYIPTSLLDIQGYYFVEFWSITDNVIPHPDPVNPKYFRVQCGAFSSKTNAINYQTKLKEQGYNSYIVLVNGLYKNQVGAFSVESNARNLSAELKAKSISNFIVSY